MIVYPLTGREEAIVRIIRLIVFVVGPTLIGLMMLDCF